MGHGFNLPGPSQSFSSMANYQRVQVERATLLCYGVGPSIADLSQSAPHCYLHIFVIYEIFLIRAFDSV